MKLHTLALISALAVSGASLSVAQTTQPGSTSGATSTGTAPTTPPTHPSERGTPSTMTPGDASGAKKDKGATDAKQTCKNLSSAGEREACMKSKKTSSSDGSMSKSGSGSMSGTSASPTETEKNGSGTGYSRPDAKKP